jgi:hypothetical protein
LSGTARIYQGINGTEAISIQTIPIFLRKFYPLLGNVGRGNQKASGGGCAGLIRPERDDEPGLIGTTPNCA